MITTPAPYEAPVRRPLIPGLALWLLIVCLLILTVPLYLLAMTFKEQRAPQAAEMTALSLTLASTPAPDAAEVELNESWVGTLNEARALSEALNGLRADHINYPDMMLVLLGFAADAMQITAVREDELILVDGGQIALSGEAASETVVRNYTDELRRQPIFGSVTVQSLETVIADPSLSATQLPPVSLDVTLAAPSSFPVRRFIPMGTYVRFTLLITLKLEAGES